MRQKQPDDNSLIPNEPNCLSIVAFYRIFVSKQDYYILWGHMGCPYRSWRKVAFDNSLNQKGRLFLSFVKWYREGYKHHCHPQVNYQDKKENKPRFLISCYMFAVRSYISGWLNRTIEECILEKKDFCKHVNWNGQDFELRAIERSTLSERNVHLYLYRKYTYSSHNVRCHWYVRYKYDFGLRMFCSVSSFPWRHKSEI